MQIYIYISTNIQKYIYTNIVTKKNQSSSLSRKSSSSPSSSSLAMLMMTDSTLSWMLSDVQYSSSKCQDCRTAPAQTSWLAQSLASSNLARRSVRVKRWREEQTWCFMQPHNCSMALSSGWAGGRRTTSCPHSRIQLSTLYHGSGRFFLHSCSSSGRVAVDGKDSLRSSSHLMRSAFFVAVVGKRLSSTKML